MEPVSAEPSWGRVLATTIRLWVWRLDPVGYRRQGTSGRPRRKWSGEHSGRLRLLSGWRLVTLLVVLAVLAAAVTEFADTAFQATRNASAGNLASRGADGPSPQAQAAAWIADQVSSDAMVACYPEMCSVLQQQGVAADRLLPLQAGAAGPIDASVIVTSPSTSSQLTDTYAPALIAASVRALAGSRSARPSPAGQRPMSPRSGPISPPASSAGSELLKNWRIQFTARDTTQLRAGRWTRACWRRLRRWQPSTRSGSRRSVTPPPAFRCFSVKRPSRPAEEGLTGAAALANEQDPPFLPTHVTIGDPAARPAHWHRVAAPSPLGLLTPTLEVHGSPWPPQADAGRSTAPGA